MRRLVQISQPGLHSLASCATVSPVNGTLYIMTVIVDIMAPRWRRMARFCTFLLLDGGMGKYVRGNTR